MILDGMDFSNVQYKEWVPKYQGWRFSRIPEDVLQKLSEKGKEAAFYNCGIEIRFF